MPSLECSCLTCFEDDENVKPDQDQSCAHYPELLTDRVKTIADRNGEVCVNVRSNLDHEGRADVDLFGILERELVLLEDLRHHAY